MSIGSSVRKLATELNMHLRIHKYMGEFRPGMIGAISDYSKTIQAPYPESKLKPFSISNNTIEKYCFTVPKIDVAIKKNIIEPVKILNINYELPTKNSSDQSVDLPLYIEKEIAEPNGIIVKKEAVYMVRVKRRKMRIHKLKKYRRKHKIELQKRKLMRSIEKENNFQAQLREILIQKDNFSAEKYVQETLEKVHWTPPVTRVKGKLAPQWVIKEYLEKQEEERVLKERIEEISK